MGQLIIAQTFFLKRFGAGPDVILLTFGHESGCWPMDDKHVLRNMPSSWHQMFPIDEERMT